MYLSRKLAIIPLYFLGAANATAMTTISVMFADNRIEFFGGALANNGFEGSSQAVEITGPSDQMTSIGIEFSDNHYQCDVEVNVGSKTYTRKGFNACDSESNRYMEMAPPYFGSVFYFSSTPELGSIGMNTVNVKMSNCISLLDDMTKASIEANFCTINTNPPTSLTAGSAFKNFFTSGNTGLTETEEALTLTVEAVSTAAAGTVNLLAPNQPCASASLDALAFGTNLFWTISEVDWSDWKTITEMSLGAAGYTSMIYTEGTDCI